MTKKNLRNYANSELADLREGLNKVLASQKKWDSMIIWVKGFIYGFLALITLTISMGLISQGKVLQQIHEWMFPIVPAEGDIAIAHSVSLKIYHSDDPNSSKALLPFYLEQGQNVSVKFEFLHSQLKGDRPGEINVFVGSQPLFDGPVSNWDLGTVDITKYCDPLLKPLENILFQLDRTSGLGDIVYIRGLIIISDIAQ